MFSIGWERQGKYMNQKLVKLKNDEQRQQVLWVPKVLLMFRLSATGVVCWTICIFPVLVSDRTVFGFDRAPGFVHLRWATADVVLRILNIAILLFSSPFKEREYYGMVHFFSIVRTLNVLLENIDTQPFTDKLPCPLHGFYLNRFITGTALQLLADYESTHDATGDN